jgi:mycothiol system anti-sigma-R factor
MSCGNPHETDCTEVLSAVYLYLDNEMPDDHALAQVRQHLDECSPCLREFGIEREVQILVSRCCSEQAPEGLRAAVIARLQEVRAQLTHIEYRAD